MVFIAAWRKWELEVQELLGLRDTPGSGNQWYAPSDGMSPQNSRWRFMVDCKHTEHKSFILTRKLLEPWLQKAGEWGCRFLLPVRIQADPHDPKSKSLDLIVMTVDDFAELLAAANR